jgi:chromosome segregation ATPase
MTITLTNEEKLTVISQHIKNLEFNKFNLEMSLVEENARLEPKSDEIASINTQIDDVEARITALTTELNKLPK